MMLSNSYNTCNIHQQSSWKINHRLQAMAPSLYRSPSYSPSSEDCESLSLKTIPCPVTALVKKNIVCSLIVLFVWKSGCLLFIFLFFPLYMYSFLFILQLHELVFIALGYFLYSLDEKMTKCLQKFASFKNFCCICFSLCSFY